MTEVAWFSEPPEATLRWSVADEIGHLKFIDPNGEVAIIPVTRGETHVRRSSDDRPGSPIWHIETQDDVATVSPSVHFIGKWHSPNPVQFKLMEELSS